MTRDAMPLEKAPKRHGSLLHSNLHHESGHCRNPVTKVCEQIGKDHIMDFNVLRHFVKNGWLKNLQAEPCSDNRLTSIHGEKSTATPIAKKTICPTVLKCAWMHYSDFREHRFVGKDALSPVAKELLQRCHLFLTTDLPFECPDPKFSLWKCILNLLSFRNAIRRREESWRNKGAFECWPFIRQSEYTLANAEESARGECLSEYLNILMEVNVSLNESIPDSQIRSGSGFHVVL
jgi:hypothetical protein